MAPENWTKKVKIEDTGITVNGKPVSTEEGEQIRIAVMQEDQFRRLQAEERLKEVSEDGKHKVYE